MSFREQLRTKIDEAFTNVEALVVGTIRTPEAQSEWLAGHADGYTCGYYDGLTDARELYDAAGVDSRAMLDQVKAREEQSLEVLRAVQDEHPFSISRFQAARLAYRDWWAARRVLEQLLSPRAEEACASSGRPP